MFPDRPVTIPNDPHNMGYQITSDPMWAFNSPQMQPGLMPPQMPQQPPQMPQMPQQPPQLTAHQPPQMPQQPPMSFGPNQMLAMQMGGYPGPSGIRPQMQMQTGGAGIGGGYDGASTDRGLDGRSPVMNPNFLHNEGGRLGGGGGGGLATNQSWMDSALGNATGYGPSGSLDLSGMGSTIKDALSSGQWGDALKGAGQGLMLTGHPLVALGAGVYKYFKGDKTDPGHSYTPAQTFPYPPPDDGEGGGDTGSSPHSMRQPIPITRRRRPGTSSR